MDTVSNKLPSNNLEWHQLGQAYLDLGWTIIPVDSNKKPLVKWKQYQARKPTADELKEWSEKSNLSGFAIVTGKISRVVVLDLDRGSMFDTSSVPLTPHSQTGSGGHHYFFKAPAEIELGNAAGFIEKTDFRGEGGYAILPPSKHPSGKQYYWIESPVDTPLADLPISLIEQLTQSPKKEELTAKVKEEVNIFEGVGESKRNDSATKVVGFLMKFIPQDQWENVVWHLLKGWNRLNQPPLSETELRSVYESIAERAIFDSQGNEKPNQAQIIVGMVLDSPIKLFTNQFHEAVLTLPDSSFLTCKIDSEMTRHLLFKMFWDSEGKPPNAEGVNNAIKTLQGIAVFDQPQIEVFNRVGRKGNTVYYDIGDGTHIVRISPDGWTLEAESPIYFRRFSHQKKQVLPQRGGNLLELFKFINVQQDPQKLLVLTFLVVSFIPDIPRAMLILHGDQGSAKSTLLRLLRELIDPSEVALLTPPDSIRELVQFASHHYTIFLDNLSEIAPNFSDAMCRLITGDGFTKRQLFSDDEDVLYAYKRVVGICGINQVATKPDLLDRSIIVPLERIPDSMREEEKQLETEFEQVKPYLLGSLFDAVSTTLRLTPTLKLTSKPRMADYFKYATAAAKHFNFTEEQLADAFNQNVKQQNEEAIDSSPVAQTLIEFMVNQSTWQGKSSELYDKLEDIADKIKIKKGFPKAPSWLWRKIKDIRPNLMACGISISKEKQLEGTYIVIEKHAAIASNATISPAEPESSHASNGSNASTVEDLSEEELKNALGA
jgi:hypothetical protein